MHLEGSLLNHLNTEPGTGLTDELCGPVLQLVLMNLLHSVHKQNV